MSITLRILVERECESLDDAIQTALDLDRSGDPIEIVSGDRVIVDGRKLRRMMCEASSN